MEPARILVEDSRLKPITPCLSATPTRVETDNGWICYVKNSGTIVCEARRTYPDGEYAITYIIKSNGFFTVARETPKNGGTRKITKKGFVAEKGTANPTNGILNLTGGNINTRKCYFRSKFFDKFLSENQIGSVMNTEPNGTYWVEEYQNISTDGIFKILEDTGELINVEVSEATWVKLYAKDDESNGVLYTNRNVLDINFGEEKILF